MESLSDESLWRCLLDGNPRAFGDVWDRHRDRVFRRLLALGHQPSDAEDLTAVTFLELWRRRTKVRFVEGSTLPWLLVTALNVSRNAQRSARRYRSLLDRLPRPSPAPDPASVAEQRDSEDTRMVREVLGTASRTDQELILLTALEGFTVREAAMTVGIGESAAKMRLSRLRGRLRDAVHMNERALVEGGRS